MLLRALFVVLSSASLFAGTAESDLNEEFARLASPSAAERGAAQRYLAAHLESKDRALVERELRVASAETRARWIEILSSEDQLAFLSAHLAASSDAEAASAGRAALEGAILRWNPEARAKGKHGSELIDAMGAWIQPRVEIDPALATAPLEPVLDLLARIAPGRLGIAVDPNHDAGLLPVMQTSISGSFTGVVRELAARHGLQLVGFACGEEKSDPARWLVLLPKPRSESDQKTALELLRDWSITFARDGAAAAPAAAAIAASGWPTGVALLARSWREDGSTVALEGLMLAARRERVAPELFDAAFQEIARTEYTRRIADGDGRRSTSAAFALGATGIRAPDGRDLCAPALAGLDELRGRTLFARLVEIDARRPNDEAARQALERVLSREDTAIGARFLALEIRARFAAPLDCPVRLNELVEFAASRGRAADLFRWLHDARSFPPEAWRDPAVLPRGWSASLRAFVAGAWLDRGETATAAAVLSQALNAADAPAREALAFAVREIVRDAEPGAAAALFARLAADHAADQAADLSRALRFVALAGAADSESTADLVLSGIAEPATAREDLLLLGALAASPRGAVARTRLVASLAGTADLDDVVAALDRALEAIRATRDFELEREFANSVRSSDAEVSPLLRARLRVGRWPPPPLGEPVRLSDMDRSPARFGL